MAVDDFPLVIFFKHGNDHLILLRNYLLVVNYLSNSAFIFFVYVSPLCNI